MRKLFSILIVKYFTPVQVYTFLFNFSLIPKPPISGDLIAWICFLLLQIDRNKVLIRRKKEVHCVSSDYFCYHWQALSISYKTKLNMMNGNLQNRIGVNRNAKLSINLPVKSIRFHVSIWTLRSFLGCAYSSLARWTVLCA